MNSTTALTLIHGSVKSGHDVDVLAGRASAANAALVVTGHARAVVEDGSEPVAAVRAGVTGNPLAGENLGPVDRCNLGCLRDRLVIGGQVVICDCGLAEQPDSAERQCPPTLPGSSSEISASNRSYSVSR